MTTFQVDDVQPNTEEPWDTTDVKTAVSETLDHLQIEAACEGKVCRPMHTPYWSDEPVPLDFSSNPFVEAVHLAFDQHLPLTLRPDDIWLCIARGFASHVEVHAEELRERFVGHEGQKYIEIRRDNFVKGSEHNDWEGCFDEFSDLIAEEIGEHNRDLLVADFSTTGPVERAASEIVLMDAMKSYLTYGMRTCCGFPSITLAGEPDDWRSVRERAGALSEFGTEWWTDHLLPVLDKIALSAKGDVDVDFWRSFYKTGGGSGGPFVTGWINTLFPYLPDPYIDSGKWKRNGYVDFSKRRLGSMCGGPNSGDFPGGLSQVDVKWYYYLQEFDMKYLGGFVGVEQDPDTLGLTPKIGWAIGEEVTGG